MSIAEDQCHRAPRVAGARGCGGLGREVERRLQQAARKLGGQLRIPGSARARFRDVVIRRLGREAVFDEALRSALGEWYVDAIDTSGSPRR